MPCKKVVIFEQRNSSLICHELLQKRKLWDTTQMKKQLYIIAYICGALLVFVNPVNAWEEFKIGDVFYCESEFHVSLREENNWPPQRFRPFKFKFKIKAGNPFDNNDNTSLEFSQGNIFSNDMTMFIENDHPGGVYARNYYGSFYLDLDNGRFNYVLTASSDGRMINGTCDKF